MIQSIIKFHKSDINHLDYLFVNYFSRIDSPQNLFVQNRSKPKTGYDPNYTGPISDNIPWTILNYDQDVRFGRITYQPGPQFDSIIIEYTHYSIEIVQDLIESIKNVMERIGFRIIDDHADLFDSQESTHEIPKRSGHPGLSRKEWAERIEKVWEGIELKKKDPTLRWNQIPGLVGWTWGEGFGSKNKLFQYSRDKLVRLQNADPDGILELALEIKKKKEKKKT